MVFSSIPAYLDSSNWHHHPQQQLQHQQNQGGFEHGINNTVPSLTNPNPLLPPPPLPPPPQHPQAQAPPPPGPMRPGSMAERARMANIPMPEMALKCPRCESTNTKFCYFNNYSLSQPRHFCKTCRRYWTRGGALRSVPVGGGCRRNKRSKSSSSSSKSAATSMPGGLASPPPPPPLRFMSPLHHLTSDFGEQLGLSSSYAGFPQLAEPWRVPPPFLGGLLDGSSLYGNPFEAAQFSGLAVGGSGGPLEAVKAEERGGVLLRRFSNNHHDNQGEQNYDWGGASSSSGSAWTHHLNSALNNNPSCSNTSAQL